VRLLDLFVRRQHVLVAITCLPFYQGVRSRASPITYEIHVISLPVAGVIAPGLVVIEHLKAGTRVHASACVIKQRSGSDTGVARPVCVKLERKITHSGIVSTAG
jgi:hypothetical protein